jgi:uncharacterized protein (TIGR02453 family)
VKSGFPGFPPEGLEFFAKLMRHNRREWFQPRKEIFEAQLKQPMRELVQALNAALKTIAPDYVTDPDKAIYRIYRDTRFSKDKTPYKDHIAASFYRRGTTGHGTGGFYVAVSHKEVAIGGGVYMPDPDLLAAIRHHIAEHHEELRRILRAKAVRTLFGEMQGEQLSRVPKGLPLRSPSGRPAALQALHPLRRTATRACHQPGPVRRSGQTFPRHGPVPQIPLGRSPAETGSRRRTIPVRSLIFVAGAN